LLLLLHALITPHPKRLLPTGQALSLKARRLQVAGMLLLDVNLHAGKQHGRHSNTMLDGTLVDSKWDSTIL
jgi:hypothetical protein